MPKERFVTAEEMNAVRRTGQVRRRDEDGAEMVRVRAVRPCLDNGVLHEPGRPTAEFEMELSLVPPHVAAGVVEVLERPTAGAGKPAKD